MALVVMWAGVGIAKDTLEPLIGEAVDPDLYTKIKRFVEKYDGIEGTHDLIVHNYGPNRSMASIHAEVPNNVNIEISHEIIDRIERDAIEGALRGLDEDCSIHDFRLVEGQEQINLIFDMVVPITYSDSQKRELHEKLAARLRETDYRYRCVITMEHTFMSSKNEG